jgi:hypothetical protein|tara:strand:+ start:2994 stop:3320 length:327 start_codon:yes stop_codon:yes gene_type:complete
MSSQLNIYVDQGTDFRLTVQLFDDDDLDLPIANYDFFGDLKKLYSAKRAAEFEFEKDGNDITLLLSADVTSQLTPGKYQYDVMMRKQSGELSKIVDGLAFVISTITEV